MTSKEDALRLTLEALEEMQNAIYNIEGEHVIGLSYAIEQADVAQPAITALKEALAKTALEPVQEPHEYDWSMLEAAKESLREHMARIKELEAALAQQAQEPFAWCIDSQNSADWCFAKTESGARSNATLMDTGCFKTEPFPLYTAPPQQPAQEPVCPECKAGVLYECVACSCNNYPPKA